LLSVFCACKMIRSRVIASRVADRCRRRCTTLNSRCGTYTSFCEAENRDGRLRYSNRLSAKLYLVPTSIGNLEDMTIRSLRTLASVDYIAAEDTRTAGILLQVFRIERKNPFLTCHEYNEDEILLSVVSKIKAGYSVALISERGTPGIADPGSLLVRACLENQVPVQALPGACSAITALIASGLSASTFTFLGFLPHKKGRLKRIKQIAQEERRTFVLFESPHRLMKLLEQLNEALGPNRPLCLSNQITKPDEKYIRGTTGSLLERFKSGREEVNGEYVFIIDGAKPSMEGNQS